MSTQATSQALQLLRSTSEVSSIAYDLATLALAEMEALTTAAADLRRLGVGDFIYKVREARDHKRDGEDGSGWHHPDVEAWGNAADLLRVIAAQRNGGTAGADGAKDAGASGAHE